MLNLFFGDGWTILSTILLILTMFYIVCVGINRKNSDRWGKKILLLVIIGLLLCIAVVYRDGYVTIMQGGVGVFEMDSLPIYLAYIVASAIAISSISTIFVRNQKYRKIIFFILCGSIILKTVIIEVSRILL